MMPYTRLQRHTELRRKSGIARKKKARAHAQTVSLQTTHYKKFCDICFEFFIRERDRWTDTLDGRRFAQGDYEHYHAAHYIPRQALYTRYDPMNCHGQSSGHNWAASPKASPIVGLLFQNLQDLKGRQNCILYFLLRIPTWIYQVFHYPLALLFWRML